MSVHEGKKKISYHIFHAIFQLQLKLVDICMIQHIARVYLWLQKD